MNMGLDLKRKSTDVHQGNEKKIKSLIEQTSSFDERVERSKHDNELIDEENIATPVINRWPKDDIQKLLSKIESVLPSTDNIIFRSRITKVDWEKVRFDNYSKDECQSTWLAIQDQLRTYKTLGELVHDAKNLLENKGIDTLKSKQNRIKKPKSVYMLFFTEMFQKYKKKYPDFKLPQLSQKIAEKYKRLLPEERQPYVNKAQKLKDEYNELICKTNLKPKINNTVPKPKTPFQIYFEFKTADTKDKINNTELQNKFKEKWNIMSEQKKSHWIKLAQEREQAFLNDLKETHKDDPKFTMPTKRALTKGEKTILDSLSGKPKKPPVNNYVLFSTEILQSDLLNDVPPKEKMSMIAQKWKSFSDEERNIYSDKLKVLTERYKTDFDEYLKTLSENERKFELSKVKPKKFKQKTELKVETKINVKEKTPEKPEFDTHLKTLPNNERKSELSKIKPKKIEQKSELKVEPKINAKEKILEKPKKKVISKYNSLSKTFENEPKVIPFKNAFELYKSQFKENAKFEPNKPIETQALSEWSTLSNKKKSVFEDELKTIKRKYMENLKVFLKSLSEEDLKLYLELRKPELIADNNENESDDLSESGTSSSGSSSSESSSSSSESSSSSKESDEE